MRELLVEPEPCSTKNTPPIIKNGHSLKGASVTNIAGAFGLGGLILAGPDLVEQFVGTMDLEIRVDEKGENLLFFVENNTSLTSAAYHALPNWERDARTATPWGNMRQLFIWKEPISASGFNEALGNVEYNPVKNNNIIDW